MDKEHQDRLKIATLVVWLQMCVFAADETMHITWFNRHKTKNTLNNFVSTVLKEHTPLLKAFWKLPDQIDMPAVTSKLQRFGEQLADLRHDEMDEVSNLIDEFIKKKRNGNI